MRRVCRLLIVVMGIFVFQMASSAGAEISGITLRVDGLSCPFCAYGLEKRLKKVDGVRDMEISINTGVVTLKITDGKTPNLSLIREAVKGAGFTTREIRITAIGTLDVQEERVQLNTKGSDQKFLLFEKETPDGGLLGKEMRTRLAILANKDSVVTVTGTVHPHAGNLPGLSADKVEQVE